jgi:aquaporin Z
MGWHISGAHYNPAITLAVLIQKKITVTDAVVYIVFQLLGATVAAFLLIRLVGHAYMPPTGFVLQISNVVIAEVIFTFILTLVTLNVTIAKATKGNSYHGLAIGVTLITLIIAGGWMSGGLYNPAIALVVHAVDTLVSGNTNLSSAWLYLAGPCVGATLASFVFGFTEKKEVK